MNTISKRILFSLLLSFFSSATIAQLLPLHNAYNNEMYSVYATSDSVRSTSVKPMLLQNHPALVSAIANGFILNKWDTVKQKYKNWGQKLINNHLFEVHDKDVHLFLDPIISYSGGKATDLNKMTYVSTRGFNAYGLVGKKVQFNLAFFENQARFPIYLDTFIFKNDRVVPGQGRSRKFKGTAFDFARTDASISYVPSERFDMVLGYGKNFIGDGYRSLLLSDNAFNYPYLRLHAKFWKINYTVLYNQYANPKVEINDNFQRKFSTIHYFTLDISKKFQIGIFESIMWQGNDTTSTRGFDLQYLNPVLFLRPVEFSLGSTDNAMLGLNFKYQLSKNSFAYSQFVLDDINLQQTFKNKKQHLNNKYGIQLGFWTKDILKLKGLNYRLEYNTVRPFTYGHRKINQNYTHYSQALAHPLGANFHEVINNFQFRKKRWYAELHSVFAIVGEDFNGNLFGNNLWGGEAGVPELGIKTLDGLNTKVGYNQVTIGWTINKEWNSNIQAQVGNRFRKNDVKSTSETFFSFGIVTNLSNYYYDF